MNSFLTSSSSSVFALLLFFVWISLISFFLYKLYVVQRRLFSGTSGKELKKILEDHFKRVAEVSNKLSDQEKIIKAMQAAEVKHIQKIGFLRFNPFSETGGDQSFVLCLLDGDDTGAIVSSLHSRDKTRVYAKAIKNGVVESSSLSQEEEEALNQARSGR